MTTVTFDKQLRLLDELTAKAEASIKKAPKGIINVMHTHGRNQYLFKESPSERPGKYLKKDKLPLAAALVQRDYARDFLAAAAEIKKKLLQIQKSGCERNIFFCMPSWRMSMSAPHREDGRLSSRLSSRTIYI